MDYSLLAKQILQEIKRANSILLHLHPYPDPDSIGSALAMMHALEAMDKRVTIISGDSPLLSSLSVLPGFDKITEKSYGELNLADFDLFIILDSSNTQMISQKEEVMFPPHFKTIVIDHHASGTKFGDIYLVDPDAPAASQILYDLFTLWNVDITPNMAKCLYVGMYFDTVKLTTPLTTSKTLSILAHLAKIAPDFQKVVYEVSNSAKPEKIFYIGLALKSLKTYFSNTVALTVVPYNELMALNIDLDEVGKIPVASMLCSVINWEITATLEEREIGRVKVSIRSRDGEKFDVSKIGAALGGGGHKAAAGITLKDIPLDEAKQKLIETMAQTFPELGNP